MRTLLLMRGAMGSGKSSFIKENGLEPYTLEGDKFRMLLANPAMDEKEFKISQKNNDKAWKMLMECLEERMKEGHFTVIDATHTTRKLTKQYEKLAEFYKYSIFYYQPETSLEQCLEWNKKRAAHKFVPETVVKKAYELIQENNFPKNYQRIYSMNEIKNFYIEDLTGKYEKIKVVGDIHSCGTALEKFLEDFSEDTLYVFCGDYFDRGIEPVKTWNIIKEIIKKSNVVMIEGNHEKWLRNWAFDFENVSKQAQKTFDALTENLDEKAVKNIKKEMRNFYRKLRQCYAFKFEKRKFLVNHGGLSYVPDMLLVSTQEMIKGIGNYDTEIDEIYEENYKEGKCQDFIQIHGHRMTQSTRHSICLEGEIEFGGELKYVEITSEDYKTAGIKNTVYDKNYFLNEFEENKNEKEMIITSDDEINALLNSRLIKIKKNDFNTYSINFNKKVFWKKIWNELTIKARGLYVDRTTGEVVARSYNKFFNIYEQGIEEVSKEALEKNLEFPLKAVTKYNGFLGILSVDHKTGEFIFATKSLISGEYANCFRKLFEKVDKNIKNYIKELLVKYNSSATFEVISLLDPHIVKYDKDKLYLLDFIENKLHINGIDIDDSFSENLKNKIKEKIISKNIKDEIFEISRTEKIINSFSELEEIKKWADTINNIEGFVFKDKRGFMFKLKNEFYNKWKRRRNLLEYYQKNPDIKFDFSKCREADDVIFMKKVIEFPFEKIEGKSIIEVRDMLEKNKILK